MVSRAKLLYLENGERKVVYINTSPFLVGSSEVCHLRVFNREKKVFFRIDRKGTFFTIAPQDNSLEVYLGSEKLGKKTILSDGLEISCAGFKFTFKKETERESFSLSALKKITEGLSFRANVRHLRLFFSILLVSLCIILLLLHSSYKSAVEKIAFEEIKTTDLDKSIELSYKFLQRFPASKYKDTVRKYLEEFKAQREQEKIEIESKAEKLNLKQLVEWLDTLKSSQNKQLLLGIILKKMESEDTNAVLKVLDSLKEFEAIRSSSSVSLAYERLADKINSASGIEKVVWINIKNVYDKWVGKKFRNQLQLLNTLKSFDTALACSYLEGMQSFYDTNNFVAVLQKEGMVCKEEERIYDIKLPKSIFYDFSSSRKVKRFYTLFKHYLNNFDLEKAKRYLNLFIISMKAIEVDVWRYEELKVDIDKMVENASFKFAGEITCYKGLKQQKELVKEIVNICLFLNKIDKDKVALAVFNNPFVSKDKKREILKDIYKLKAEEEFYLLNNKLVSASVLGCNLLKAVKNFETFTTAINKLKQLLEVGPVDINSLRKCVGAFIEGFLPTVEKDIERELVKLKDYVELSSAIEALDKHRKEALEKIFDEKFYTYDMAKNDHGEKAQPEIDKLVNNVRQIWEKPVNFAKIRSSWHLKTILSVCENLKKVYEGLVLDAKPILQSKICNVINLVAVSI
jgi:hypothetical protein